MITIDHNACIHCGQCVSVCPFTVLEQQTDGTILHTGKHCLACMHCAAICPKRAIVYNGKPAVCRPAVPLPEHTAATIEQLLYQRRSYRRFQKKRIPESLLQQAMQAAMMAPSAKNEHPVRWMILRNPETLQHIMQCILQYCEETGISPEIPMEYARGNNPVIGEHAEILVGYCKKTALNPSQDTAIALTTAELILQANGVGTCWGGYLTRFLNQIPACRDMLSLPEDCAVYGTLMMGYPAQAAYCAVPKRVEQPEIQWK